MLHFRGREWDGGERDNVVSIPRQQLLSKNYPTVYYHLRSSSISLSQLISFGVYGNQDANSQDAIANEKEAAAEHGGITAQHVERVHEI